jgi:hypothetical protein
MIDDDDYGTVGGMRISRGNRSTRRKPAPVQLCPPQVPHEVSRVRTWPAATTVEVGDYPPELCHGPGDCLCKPAVAYAAILFIYNFRLPQKFLGEM